MSKLRSFYIPHERVVANTEGPSMTRQEFVEECDINSLMARYDKGAMFPPVQAEPRYLDLTGVPDFHSAMQLLIDADNAFMSLPASTRKEFDNDPAKFVAFAEKPDNLPRMREWGLAPPEKAPDAPMKVEVIPPPGGDKPPPKPPE